MGCRRKLVQGLAPVGTDLGVHLGLNLVNGQSIRVVPKTMTGRPPKRICADFANTAGPARRTLFCLPARHRRPW